LLERNLDLELEPRRPRPPVRLVQIDTPGLFPPGRCRGRHYRRRAPRQAQLALALVKAMLRDAQHRGHRIDPAVLTLAPPSYDERESVYLTLEHLEPWRPGRPSNG
jgi:hypothetical protein